MEVKHHQLDDGAYYKASFENAHLGKNIPVGTAAPGLPIERSSMGFFGQRKKAPWRKLTCYA
jgi:hypothetical protein